jgi:hypothetical protein
MNHATQQLVAAKCEIAAYEIRNVNDADADDRDYKIKSILFELVKSCCVNGYEDGKHEAYKVMIENAKGERRLQERIYNHNRKMRRQYDDLAETQKTMQEAENRKANLKALKKSTNKDNPDLGRIPNILRFVRCVRKIDRTEDNI